MLIDLQNKVIILDEAHNIEDCARDAASLTINSEELAEVTKEINDIGTWYITKPALLHGISKEASLFQSFPSIFFYMYFLFFYFFTQCHTVLHMYRHTII